MKMFYCSSLKEIRVSTLAENRFGNSLVSRRFDQVERALPTTRTSDSARFSENYFNVCKQIFSLQLMSVIY